MKKRILITAFLTVSLLLTTAQTHTVGLIRHDAGGADDGYVLFAPMPSNVTYLIDKCGHEVFHWTSNYQPGFSAYLLQDGNLLRTGKVTAPYINFGGVGGIIEKTDWNNNVLWSYLVSDSNQVQHHDIEPLPNGNILVLIWEQKTVAEAIAAGRNPANLGNSLLSEKIIELQPVGTDSANIVWQWDVWDHLIQHFAIAQNNYGVIPNNPQLVNINFPANLSSPDWIHLNSVKYNPALDQIVVCGLGFSEIWIIDHSTTTAQAAGHTGGNSGKGGDLLYRWGNPVAYAHGTVADKKFYHLHDAHWIASGLPDANNILIFNNGAGRPGGNYSTVEILAPPVDIAGNYSGPLPFGPDSTFWKYKAPVPSDFFSNNLGGAQQLQNGNVIICNGAHGDFFEINNSKNKIWEYINPVTQDSISWQGDTAVSNNVFHCIFYPSSYSGFAGKTLTPGLPVEHHPLPDSCDLTVNVSEYISGKDIAIFPNPASDRIKIKTDADRFIITIYNIEGQQIFVAKDTKEIVVNGLPEGIYIISVRTIDDRIFYKKLLIAH
jgi:hypothetical protein